MLNDLYTFSVPVFLRGHAVLSELLRKGEAHAAGYKITPSALLTARLFPDMFPLTGQVQAACDTAKRATARLVGVEPPRFEDNEATFEELYARIQRTSEFVEKFEADAFRDAELRKIELNMSAGVVSLTAEKYLTRFALPNFYFSRDNGLRYSPAQRGHPRQARLPGRALPGLAALLIIAHPRKPSVGSKGRWGLARSRWDCTVTRQSPLAPGSPVSRGLASSCAASPSPGR